MHRRVNLCVLLGYSCVSGDGAVSVVCRLTVLIDNEIF